jgi:hypothetical protein
MAERKIFINDLRVRGIGKSQVISDTFESLNIHTKAKQVCINLLNKLKIINTRNK